MIEIMLHILLIVLLFAVGIYLALKIDRYTKTGRFRQEMEHRGIGLIAKRFKTDRRFRR